MSSLQQAYDSAAVVFSRSFRFVDWKFIVAADPSSMPFGDKGASRDKATKPIQSQRWIYVFREDADRNVLKEEIWLSAKGELYATPWDDNGDLTKKNPLALGKSMCLPRRVLGHPKAYRFYSSRVRLTSAEVADLAKNISKFAPRTYLEPTKNSSVIEKDGELLVPVVDPITVALHLNAAYESAAKDVIDYTTPHAGLKGSELMRVSRRRKKQLLAQLMLALIGQKKNDNAVTTKLIHELKDMQAGIEDYVAHYNEAVRARTRHRDHLANLLVKWLSSDGMRIAMKAQLSSKVDSAASFLAVWGRCISRLNESLPGRDYLSALLKDEQTLAKSYIWPKTELTGDPAQAVRKAGLSVLEGWRAIAEARVLIQGGTGVADEIVQSLKKLRGYTLSTRPLSAARLAKVKSLNRSIQGVELVIPTATKDVTRVASELRGLAFIVEGLNLVLAVRAVMDANLDPRERELAIIGLVGSSLDAGSALATLLNKSEHLVAVLGFVSGVIDVYLGVQEMDKGFKSGDQDAADAAFVTAVGASISTSSALMTLMAVPGANVVAVIGLAVTAIGIVYKLLTSKSDLDKFFLHSTWGKEFGKSTGKEDWSSVSYDKWNSKDDTGLDYQLEALLNIICKFELSHGDTFRDLKFKLGWVPDGAKLSVKYSETWKNRADSRDKQTEVTFNPLSSSDASFRAAQDGAHGLKLSVLGASTWQKSTNAEQKTFGVRPPMPDLRRVAVDAALTVGFDVTQPISIPFKRSPKLLYER